MTRIVGGLARGRRLQVTSGARTRPTSERVREALFSTLESTRGGWSGARVLDLYAGSGALGLEALSRGATTVQLVEHARPALAVLHRNVDAVGLPGARVVAARVERYVGAAAAEPFDVVLVDPPYPLPGGAVTDVLTALVRHGWLATDAVVVVERATRSGAVEWPDGLTGTPERRYGETTLWYGHRTPDPQAEGAT